MFSLSCQPRASDRGRVEAQYLYGYLYPQGIANVRLYIYILTGFCSLVSSGADVKRNGS